MQTFTVLFFSSAEISIPLFEALLNDERFEVIGLVCQPDKPVGRDGVLTAPKTKVLAQERGIPVFQPEKLKALDLKGLGPDFLLTFAYGQILSEKVLALAKKEALNVHASLLPKYRGASPIQSAILNGDVQTGISLMRMEKKMDAGPVCMQWELSLGGMNAGELHDAISDMAALHVPDALAELGVGNLGFQAQDESEVSYCGKVSRDDGFVDFQESAEGILRMHRAYMPWPGLWTTFGGKRLKLLEIELSDKDLLVGEVNCEDGMLFVGTIGGSLKINKLQLEGKQALHANDFLIGQPEFCSMILPS
jgi:methionyl-tRNA formyltransferase